MILRLGTATKRHFKMSHFFDQKKRIFFLGIAAKISTDSTDFPLSP